MSNLTPTPFPTTLAPGIGRDVLAGVVVSTSPAAMNFTLPRQGIYLATITCTAITSTNRIVGLYLLKWVSNSGQYVLGSDLLGSHDQSGAGITGLTVADPTTAGLVALTLSHSSGATQVNFQVVLHELVSEQDQYNVV